jgi:hypothetical protein
LRANKWQQTSNSSNYIRYAAPQETLKVKLKKEKMKLKGEEQQRDQKKSGLMANQSSQLGRRLVTPLKT